MYEINDTIRHQAFDGLKVQKLVKTDFLEILSISIEKDTLFPEHTSPSDAQLIILNGDIDFHIDNRVFHLIDHQHFSFPKGTSHWVKANENSKFLIIR